MSAHLDLRRMFERHVAVMSPIDSITIFRRAIEGNRLQVLANTFIDESKEAPQRTSCALLLGMASAFLRDARRSLLKDELFLKGLKKVLGDNYGPDYPRFTDDCA